MNKKIKDFMVKHGYKETDKKELETYTSKINRHISVDVTNENGDILFCRSLSEKAKLIIKDNRLVIYKADRLKTYIVNVTIDSITNCMIKGYDAGIVELLFSIKGQDISYKITIR